MIMWVWFNNVGVVNYVSVDMAVQVCFCFLQPWWKDKFRRPNHRQIYETRHPGHSETLIPRISKHVEPVSFLHVWDEWTKD